MNEIQSKLYELLVKFDTRCRQHDIEYYLSGGTMIGAMRHHGFIPWDDDVDLYISRKNYKKLLACKESFFDDDFVLINNQEFPQYGNTIVRCVDTHSTSITKARLLDGTPKGEFLELFILDPLPDEPRARHEWLTKHWIYAELMAFAFRVANQRIDPWIDEALYNHYFERYKTEGRDVILKELEDELFSIEETEVNDWCSRWGIAVRTYPIKWFGKPRLVPFGDTELPVQSAVERVLRYEYGDTWANIPLVNNQATHSIIRNQKIGYRQFVDEYMQYINAEKLFGSYPERDEASLDTYFADRRLHAKRIGVKEAHCKGAISRMHNVSGDETAYEDEFAHAYSVWRNHQLSLDFWKWQVCIDLDDADLALFLEHFIETDGFSPVKTLLEWRKRTHILPEQLCEIDTFVGGISEVYTLIDEGKYGEARSEYNSLIEEQYQRYLTIYDIRYLDVLLGVKTIDSISNLEDLLKKAQALVDDFPESGDALFLLGKIENAAGLKDKSYGHLNRAKAMTRNAFFLREIDEFVPNATNRKNKQDAHETMNGAQAVLVKLLSEIHEVCQEENIPYFVAGEAALSAYRSGKFESDATHIEVLMLFEDALRLTKKLSNRPHRTVESLYTNKKYPDISFRYCDTETTRVMLDSNNLPYEHWCICIDIQILRVPFHGFWGRLTRTFERVWKLYRGYSERIKKRIKHFGFWGRAFDAVFRHTQGCCRALLKPLFRHTQRKASFSDKLALRYYTGERVNYSKHVFDSGKLVHLEEQPCFIAGKYSDYFVSMYGRDWPNKTIRPKQEKQTTIVDTCLPYKQFVMDIVSAGETLDFTAEYAEQLAAKKRYDALDSKITKAWNIAWRTEAKFRMQERYEPLKQNILSLQEQEKWPELIELFAEYDDVAITYEKKNLSVKFDEELFNIYLEILRRQGRDKLAKHLEELSLNEKPLPEANIARELNSNSGLSESTA